jgi:hypothetical protein
MSLLARVKNKIHAAKYSAMMAPIVVVVDDLEFHKSKVVCWFFSF